MGSHLWRRGACDLYGEAAQKDDIRFCELKSNEFAQICLNPKWPRLNGRLSFSGDLIFSLAPSLSPH